MPNVEAVKPQTGLFFAESCLHFPDERDRLEDQLKQLLTQQLLPALTDGREYFVRFLPWEEWSDRTFLGARRLRGSALLCLRRWSQANVDDLVDATAFGSRPDQSHSLADQYNVITPNGWLFQRETLTLTPEEIIPIWRRTS